MSPDDPESDKLASTLSALRRRWGDRAVRRGPAAVSPPPASIPTGFTPLDAALGGGVPRQRITELTGIPTSGMATLALKIVAQAQQAEGTAVYLDPNHTFDPDYAHRCGVTLSRLTLVRPAGLTQLGQLLVDIAATGAPDVLVCDLPLMPAAGDPQMWAGGQQALATALGRLVATLNHAACAVLCLTTLSSAAQPADPSAAHAVLSHYAAVRLQIRRERWMYTRQDVTGYAAQVQLLKNKFGRAGQQVPIAITFNGTVHGDGA